VQIQIGHRAAFSNWNRLVTVLCGRRSNTAPAASKCYNRPNDADSWRNHKNIFAVILPLKSKAQLFGGPIVGICSAAEKISEEFQYAMRDLNNRVGVGQLEKKELIK
jgi:hypothetical protein